jgi:hypothetical protein
MLSAVSSPRAEGASPPSPRCSDAKKAVKLKCLAVKLGACSYRATKAETLTEAVKKLGLNRNWLGTLT